MAKNKNKKGAVAFLVFLVISALTYWQKNWIKDQFKKIAPANKEEDTNPSATGTGKSKPKSNIFPLRIGSHGSAVEALQAMLNHKYKSGLDIDGDFGKLTKAALLKAGFSYPLNKSIYQGIITP